MSLAAGLRAAAVGDVAAGVLVPLSQQGKLRVTYDWLHSALNCNPQDDSDFIWLLTKLDDQRISLSPRDPHAGRRLYASVRDDWDYYVQVQPPYAADWITTVGRNETLLVEGGDLMTLSLRGWNGQFLTVDPGRSADDSHSGYRVRSAIGADHLAQTFFFGVTERLQPKIPLPLRTELATGATGRGQAGP